MLSLILLVLVSSGCAGSLRHLTPFRGVEPLDPANLDYDELLQIQYLGSSGFLIRRGQDAILTAPFFSNPGILRVGLGSISPNTRVIDDLLPPVGDVEAILVGHAHYDHALDLPYIMSRGATNAVVYGNHTLSNILSAALPCCRIQAVEAGAGEFRHKGRSGEWIEIAQGRIRFMALESEHAPHLFGRSLFKGEITERQCRLPRTAWGWKGGVTLAYLIDFMNPDKSVAYRIVFQDTATNYPRYGGIPELPPSEQKVPDVQILCLASFEQVDQYPKGVVSATSPRYVIVGHWEDFFLPREKLKVIRLTNARRFMEQLECVHPANRTFLPVPGAWMAFEKQ